MPVLIISDPETGRSQRVELEAAQMNPLIGRRRGGTIDGTIANLAGYRIQLTGGTDKDGIPMRPDVTSPRRRVREREWWSGGTLLPLTQFSLTSRL